MLASGTNEPKVFYVDGLNRNRLEKATLFSFPPRFYWHICSVHRVDQRHFHTNIQNTLIIFAPRSLVLLPFLLISYISQPASFLLSCLHFYVLVGCIVVAVQNLGEGIIYQSMDTFPVVISLKQSYLLPLATMNCILVSRELGGLIMSSTLLSQILVGTISCRSCTDYSHFTILSLA